MERFLNGYLRLGKPVLWGFVGVTLLTMFTVQAAVTLVTAGLAIYLTGSVGNPFVWSLWILVFSAFLLIGGRYTLLSQLMKVIIILLTIVTFYTVGAATIQYGDGLQWSIR